MIGWVCSVIIFIILYLCLIKFVEFFEYKHCLHCPFKEKEINDTINFDVFLEDYKKVFKKKEILKKNEKR